MAKNTIKSIGEKDWIQRWAGSYTFISCDYWGRQYYDSLKEYLEIGFKHSLFIHRKGTVSFFLMKSEFEDFGKTMAMKAVANLVFTKSNLKTLKDNADKINDIMDRLHGKIPSFEDYQKFLFLYEKHLPFHNFMKKTVDFLDEKNMKKLLPLFKEARLYSENVYSNTESFFRSVSAKIAKKSGYNAEHLTCLTQKELEEYLLNQKLPKKSTLRDRFINSALYFENGKRQILLGKQVELLEKKMLEKEKAKQELSGTNAFPGLVRGLVRVVPDPFKVKKFDEGNILVTGMTRPEFVALVKKSCAIITDSGGILCHAAITAREFKKPCVVGTQVATKVLKDGDLVEVDATKGTVKIIKKA